MDKHTGRRQSSFSQPARPGMGSLLYCILRGILLGGFTWPVMIIAAAAVYLYINAMPYREYAALALVFGIVVTGLVRGCIDWQQERADYQRQLARMRHRAYANRADTDRSIPGFIPFYRR